MLPELIPVEKFKEWDKKDFGKCSTCDKEYQIYHINGVCFDCDIEKRKKEDKEFRDTINAHIRFFQEEQEDIIIDTIIEDSRQSFKAFWSKKQLREIL